MISVESINGEVVRDFLNIPWDDHIQQMDIEGTYEDKLTLRAFANIFNIEIKIVSTLGNDGQVSINPENSNPLGGNYPRTFRGRSRQSLRVPSKRDCRR